MSLSNAAEIVDAHLNGQQFIGSWRKLSSVATPTTGGAWGDLSMAPGNPNPQYYAATPLTSVALSQSVNGGIPHGAPVSPSKKYLRKILFYSNGNSFGQLILCDYLLFYSFIDESIEDEQFMTNSVSLPRYTSGEGVKIMTVTVGARTGGQTFRITYTNSQGVAGRVTPTTLFTTNGNNYSNIGNSGIGANVSAPFIALQDGDTGVQSIQSFQMLSGTDVGLTALVLVKPIAMFQCLEQTAPVEVDYLKDFGTMPQVEDDAYLNIIVQGSTSFGSVGVFGINTYIWG